MASLTATSLQTGPVGPVDLRIASGECVALSGPSGGGKTRLLRAIADLDPHQGTVRLGSRTCSATPAPEWRRCVGLLPAEPRWWRANVRDHFAGDEPPTLMDRLGFTRETWSFPVDRLSSGESQRLALVRLLMQEPEALLLDEPTAHLDDEWRRTVEEIVAEYRVQRDVPVLWVTHDAEQAQRVASRHLVLDGELAEPAR